MIILVRHAFAQFMIRAKYRTILLEEDAATASAPTIEHIASTERRIKFREVELKPKIQLEEAQPSVDPEKSHVQPNDLEDDGAVSHPVPTIAITQVGDDTEEETQARRRIEKGKGVERGNRTYTTTDGLTSMDVDVDQ